MVVMRALAVLVVAGCGRFDFDARVDAAADASTCISPIGHDEDGDGLDDNCDPCPNLAGDATDTDQDGVGDACDPSASPLDRIAMFDPFVATRTDLWRFPGTSSVSGDALVMPGITPSSTLYFVDPPGNDVYSFELDITAIGGGNQRQYSFGVRDVPTTHWYYCEFTDLPAQVLKAGYTPDAGQNYFAIQVTNVDAPLVPGHARFEVDHSSTNLTCRLTWNGAAYTAGGAIPAAVAGEESYLSANNVDLNVQSVVRVAKGS